MKTRFYSKRQHTCTVTKMNDNIIMDSAQFNMHAFYGSLFMDIPSVAFWAI